MLVINRQSNQNQTFVSLLFAIVKKFHGWFALLIHSLRIVFFHIVGLLFVSFKFYSTEQQ